MWKSLRIVVTTLGLLFLGSQHSHAVVLNGLDWRQLTDTTGLSWNDVSGVCNGTNNACSGSVGGVNFDGWFWASPEQVGDLFAAYIPNPPYDPTKLELGQAFGFESNDFTDYIATTPLSLLNDTITGVNNHGLWGHVTGMDSFGGGREVRIAYISGQIQVSQSSNGLAFTNAELGTWLYRDTVAPIPVPAAFPLLAGALGLMGIMGWRRKRKAAAV